MLVVEITCRQCSADETQIKALFEGFNGKVVLHNCVFQAMQIQGPSVLPVLRSDRYMFKAYKAEI